MVQMWFKCRRPVALSRPRAVQHRSQEHAFLSAAEVAEMLGVPLVARKDGNGAETWYGLWCLEGRRVKRALPKAGSGLA